MLRTIVAVGLVSALALPFSAGALDTTQCRVYTYQPTAQAGGFYLYLNEVRQESNGIPGLQREWSSCGAAGAIAPDACLTHLQPGGTPNCVAGYADTLAP